MSDTNAQEPTMEEILASIRRIISEDDAPAPKIAVPAPSHPVLEAALPPGQAPATVQQVEVATPPPPPPPEDDVLELTEPLWSEPDPKYEPAPQAHQPPAPPPPAYEPMDDLDFATSPPSFNHDEPLVGAPAAGVAASHFGQLARSIAVPSEGRTLEDIVVAVLRPMLKDWLDRYLPQIVEAKVQAEVERISRSNVH